MLCAESTTTETLTTRIERAVGATWHLYNTPSSRWMSPKPPKPDYLQRVAALSRKRGKR